MIAIVGLGISIYAVQAVLKMRGEKVSRRTDPVLATSIGRLQYATSHLVFAIAGSAGVLAVGGLFTGLTYRLITGEVGREVGRVLGAAMVHLPAIWVLAAIAIALFGLLLPWVAASGAWGALAAFLVIGLFGELLQLPQWTLDISPFNHIPKLPGGEFTIAPIVWILAIAAVLTIAGLIGFRQRDINRA